MSPGGAMDRPNFLLADKCYIVHHKLIHKKKGRQDDNYHLIFIKSIMSQIYNFK
jgi:hypothetical protein